jgi:hypothetical protein
MLAVVLTLAVVVAVAQAEGPGAEYRSARAVRGDPAPGGAFREARLETLWIFWADFEDEIGDNAGWTTYDRSGTLDAENYWHHDTIRIGGFAHLGDTTWWCGTYADCWLQPRGYGNDWLQILERSFPEIEANTDPGDPLFLDWDQRFAMEHNYDYGYIDVSSDGGSTWTTVHTVTNPGFASKPGLSQDWDSPAHGHMSLDMSSFAGTTIDLRYRFVSDEAYSSADQYNNGPPNNSVLDGAWQLDNITWTGPGGAFWLDDCESGNMGWIHDDTVAAGQTGIVYFRGQFGLDFVTGRDFTCEDRPVGTWMMGAVDPFTSTMVDGQASWLMSPPIDISGAPKLVAHWDQWCDMPATSGDVCNLSLASDDVYDCVTDLGGFVDEDPGWWYADPDWYEEWDDWDAFAGNDWLAILWQQQNDSPPEPGAQHWAGLILNIQKVGIPSADPSTSFLADDWNWYNDWFQEQLSEAMLDSARLKVKDDDGVDAVVLMASNDGGTTWSTYGGHKEDPQSDWWVMPPPSAEMLPGSEIRLYFEATDGLGNVSLFPEEAPDLWYEMSILPLEASVSNPGILIVDKHGRLTPGETRATGGAGVSAVTRPLPSAASESYYAEMLGILGYEYEVYDVEVPSASSVHSDGPDSAGYKYYDTQIWWTNDFNAYTVKPPDQVNLINWLNESAAGKERNLLLTGNDIGFEIISTGTETLGFYGTWLASDFLENSVGAVLVDSVPGVLDNAGGFAFITHDDAEFIIRGACPVLNKFDVIDIAGAAAGAELVADYIRQDSATKPAGVAYTHPTMGYQTVNLGFGMEFVMDGTYDGGSSNYTAEGYYKTGIHDRVNLMQNIMTYFAKTPSGNGTGIVDGGPRNELSPAYPNPFNPVTKIAYSVKETGPVAIRVYNAAGKLVRTLLTEELEAGDSGVVAWDGSDDAGERCASGVYFYRIEASGFSASGKMVMLK